MSKLKALFANKYFLLVLVVLVWLLADQFTKYLVVDRLTTAPFTNGECLDGFERFWSCPHPSRRVPVEVMGQALSFVYVENPGAAFGSFTWLNDTTRPIFLLVLVAVTVLVMVFIYTQIDGLVNRIALASVIGGAIGNWIDRFRLSYVIDFISNDFGFPPFNPWPIYNVADIAVTVGVVVLVLVGFFENKKKSAANLPAADKQQ